LKSDGCGVFCAVGFLGETFQSMVSIVSTMLLGIAIGISFMKVKWLLLGYQI
jgi:ABC-type amino acid transport system permease subunit